MIKTIILDIDNTLYDYNQANVLGLEAVYSYCVNTFAWSKEEAKANVKRAQRDAIDELGTDCAAIHNRLIRYQIMLEQHHLPLYPHVMNLYNAYWNTLMDHMVLSKGAEGFLSKCKSLGLRIGIATDMTAHIQYRKLERMGLLKYFDFMVSSEEVGEEKPSKKLFERCLKKAECQPEECLMIGDVEKKDIAGAASCGIPGILFRPGDNLADILENKNYF